MNFHESPAWVLRHAGIREAVPEDIPSLVALAKRHHREQAFPFPFDAAQVSVTFAAGIQRDDWLLLTEERSLLFAISFECPFGRGRLASERLFIASRPEIGRALIERYEAWARGWGCSEVSLACTSKPELFERLYRRRGYAHAETVFAKRL